MASRTWGSPAQRAALKKAQAASAAKRKAKAGNKSGGRIAARVSNESMLMRPKQSQAELDREVAAAGRRARARRKAAEAAAIKQAEKDALAKDAKRLGLPAGATRSQIAARNRNNHRIAMEQKNLTGSKVRRGVPGATTNIRKLKGSARSTALSRGYW